MQITYFPSLTETSSYTQHELGPGLDDLRAFLGVHRVLPDKLRAPGFGPYKLPNGARRSDTYVQEITLAVFDVDTFTDPTRQMFDLRTVLNTAGLSYVIYTSYSHSLTHRAYRLLLPLKTPVPARDWQAVRLGLISKFQIPADPDKCSGLSHFYFLPSCPPQSVDEAYVEANPGISLDWTTVPRALVPTKKVLTRRADYQLPDEPTEPLDLTAARELLRNQATGLLRRKSQVDKRKGELLLKVLAGEALAQHGSRDDAARDCAGSLVYRLWGRPECTVGTIYALMAPSIEQMITEGSSLTQDCVERKIESSMRNKDAEIREHAEIRDNLARSREMLEAPENS